VGAEGCEIMLTGRFDSDNWILAHIGPLSASKECSHLWMVSTNPVPEIPKVTAIYPPAWLARLAGGTGARLVTFMWSAMKRRPHVVGGFYLIPNGIAAAIVGRLSGARSIYFCTGGPAEVQDGGVYSKDNLTAKMETPDPVVEKRLMKIVSGFDAIITMGTKAASFFRTKGIDADLQVVPGGIDSNRFQPAETDPSFDLILTGRLASIKRIDVFLQAVKNVADELPGVRAVIVGDGELRDELQKHAKDLGIGQNVSFAGHQDCVEDWLRKSKVVILTSDSEGLSLSMMEAMMCGLPAIVSDVGDLGDLVEDGVNGYLVPRRSPRLFADRIIELLADDQKRAKFAQAAHSAALRYEMKVTIKRWEGILGDCRRP